MSSCEKLCKEVVGTGLCTLCGACINLCPYLRIDPRQGVIRSIDSCGVEGGRCILFCPRAELELNSLSQSVFRRPYAGADIGEVRDVVMARSLDREIRTVSQYGGVVTTLMTHALRTGVVDATIVTKSINLVPQATMATTRQQILQTAGSNYVACSTLAGFNRATADSANKIGIVGVPCQIQALAKRRTVAGSGNNVGKLSLTIGLFCTWALERSFVGLLDKETSLGAIRKMDIPPPPAEEFQVYHERGRVSLPLAQVRQYVRPACRYCTDMTSEFADISVGSAEGVEGWNTVIARTSSGAALMRGAQEEGLLEVKNLPGSNLSHLEEASLNKRRRAFKNICEHTGSSQDLWYLKADAETRNKLLR